MSSLPQEFYQETLCFHKILNEKSPQKQSLLATLAWCPIMMIMKMKKKKIAVET